MLNKSIVHNVISESMFKKGPPMMFIEMGGSIASKFDEAGLHNPGGFSLEEAPCTDFECDLEEGHTHILARHDGRTRIEYEEDQYLIKTYGGNVLHPGTALKNAEHEANAGSLSKTT